MNDRAPTADDAALAHTVQALAAEVAELRAVLEALPSAVVEALGEKRKRKIAAKLTQQERGALRVLLLALQACKHFDSPWSVRELLNDSLSDGTLRAALMAALGTLDDTAGRRLGKLLARGSGIVIGRLRVERADADTRDGGLWCLRVSASFPNSHKPAPPRDTAKCHGR